MSYGLAWPISWRSGSKWSSVRAVAATRAHVCRATLVSFHSAFEHYLDDRVLPLRVGKVLLDEDVTMPDGSTIPRGTELAPDTELPTGTKIYLQKR